jgi:rhodanese-related sulfurtransferase
VKQRNARRTRTPGGRPETARPNGRQPKARAKGSGSGGRSLPWFLIGGGLLVATIAVAIGVSALSGGSGRTATATSSPAASVGGAAPADSARWTDIGAEELAATLQAGDVTLLNVKTPYIGEIEGTDLYIPYTDLVARAAELPQDRSAPIVVYCRTGNQSAIAAQMLLDLGYTNIENLAGGMTGWVESGRGLIQLARS